MEQPNSTNPQSQPSLDDEVASLLESVKSTQVEAPAESDDRASEVAAEAADEIAREVDGDTSSSLDEIIAADADANAELPSAEPPNAELPNAVTKISGDTAAIDEQLDVLSRQAADLAALADEKSSSPVGEAVADAGAKDIGSPETGEPEVGATEIGVPGVGAPDMGAPDEGAVDVAEVMNEVAADVEAIHAAPAPTNVEDAAALAAEMLAKASAAVAEATGQDAAAVEAVASEAVVQSAATLDEAIAVQDPTSESLDSLLAGLGTPSGAEATPVALEEAASRIEEVASEPAPVAAAPAIAKPAPAEAPKAAPSAAYDDRSSADSIKSLDDQIAQLSEDLLNEPAGMDAIMPRDSQSGAAPAPTIAHAAPPRAPAHVAKAPEPTAHAPAPAAATAPSHHAAAPAHAGPAHTAPAHAAPAHAHGAPAHAHGEARPHHADATEPKPPAPSLRQRLAPTFKGVAASLGSLTGVVTPLLAVLSAPLAKKPRIVRDSLGWIAVNTVFCASCLWGYMLFLRPAQIAEQHAAFDLANSELPDVPAHAEGDSHDAAAGGHEAGGEAGGHEAKKDDGHGAKKDAGHGAKKEAGGHGDAKGAAKKPEAYKPPSRKTPAKGAAKAKPKEAGHGGGH